MSGNSTRLAVGVGVSAADAFTAGWLILTFLMGVVLGTITRDVAGRWHQVAVLTAVTLLLALAAIAGHAGHRVLAVFATAIAMGNVNSLFDSGGRDTMGALTYMTGAIVKTGQYIAEALMGGDRWAWLPYIGRWAGLVSGAILGSVVYTRIGLAALWFPAIATGLLALFAVTRIPPPE